MRIITLVSWHLAMLAQSQLFLLFCSSLVVDGSSCDRKVVLRRGHGKHFAMAFFVRICSRFKGDAPPKVSWIA
jgi:hypothetical protein